MKRLTFLLTTLLFLSVIGINQANAQAVVVDAQPEFTIGGEEITIEVHAVQTPSGNIIYLGKGELSPGNPAIPEKGVNVITVNDYMEIKVTKKGKVYVKLFVRPE